MRRLPLRLRLALAFAIAMAIVLAAVGAFLYLRLGHSLLEQVDDTLEARVAAGGGAAAWEEGITQVYRPDGRLASSIPPAEPLASPDELELARGGSLFLTRGTEDGEGLRLLVAPTGEGGAVVAAASLDDRQEALDGLVGQLLVAGPLALLLASLGGYLLAGAALRPVEAMRRRAAEISAAGREQRLPLPEARDEIRRLGETLNEMLARLEAGLARERRFVADASHELRTPLALLRTELELALRRTRSAAEYEAALRSAAEEVDRLTLLAEDLLVLARLDEGELAVRRSPVEADELLVGVARRFALRADAQGRAIEVSTPGVGRFDGDRLRLEQALANLVDNALRHGAGTIRLAASDTNGRVELRVSDEGTGFPPAFLAHAFERFARVDESRGDAAAGLGLAIVDAVARAHGGRAEAANGEHGGAVVSLVIPAGRAPQPGQEAAGSDLYQRV
jgi:signal transduction histidine kinase